MAVSLAAGAALHGGVAAALTTALMPCRTIPRLAAEPALTTACLPCRGQARRRGQLVEEHRTLGVGAPSWAARRRAPHPCPPGDEARGRPPRLYGWVRALPLRPPPVRC